MKKKREEIESKRPAQDEEVEEPRELNAKELKKKKREEGKEKRKKARKMDKVERWGGMILLGMILLIGFLLWVAGEMQY